MATETAREIEQKAALWAARLDRGPLSPVDQAALDDWLDGDARRLGAYARARAVAVHSLRAAALGSGDLSHAALNQPAPMNRRALIAASVGVVSIGGAGLFAAQWRRSQQFETRKGEIRTVHLEDGSSMVLNTQSSASVRFNRDTRDIILTYGEALFTAVSDPARPFVVVSAGARIVSAGGRFLVRRLDRDPLQVTALDSKLEVRSPGRPSQRLSPSMAVLMDRPDAAPTVIDVAAAGRALAWRDRMLAFQNESLSRAAGEFARFGDRKIVLADETVADLRITGLFSVDDPAAFARAAAISLNLRATARGDEILLSSV